jgi:hypothetical protein
MEWIILSQDRDQWRALVNTVMNLLVPQHVGTFLSSLATDSFLRRAQLHITHVKATTSKGPSTHCTIHHHAVAVRKF